MSKKQSSDRTGYNPLELIAELLHFGWRDYKLDAGFRYGVDRRPEAKQHPHICAWSEKNLVDRNQDRFQAALILDAWTRGEVTEANLPEKIHEVWVQWVFVVGNKSDHATRYANAHKRPKGPEEHETQAKLLIKVLQTIPQHPPQRM